MNDLETKRKLHDTQEHLQEARNNLHDMAYDLSFSWNKKFLLGLEQQLKTMQNKIYKLAAGDDPDEDEAQDRSQ